MVESPSAIPRRIGINVPTTNESPIPATGPISPARIPFIISPSISSPFAFASSRPAVTPTTTVPSCGSVLKKALYVSSASFCSSFVS